MTALRLLLAQQLVTVANGLGSLALRLLPEAYQIEVESLPVVLPPQPDPSVYVPRFIDVQCAAIVERYGHMIILANATAYAIPQREQEGRC